MNVLSILQLSFLPSKMYFCHRVSKSVNVHQQLTNDWPYSPFILTDILNRATSTPVRSLVKSTELVLMRKC